MNNAVAVSTITPTTSFHPIPTQYSPSDLPTIGDPSKVCPDVMAYYENLLSVPGQIELCYSLVAEQDVAERTAQEEQCWQVHDTPVDSPLSIITQPSVPSTAFEIPRLRSCRQTGIKKTADPKEKRELNRYEQKLLKWGVLPRWIRDWSMINLIGEQRLWYANAVDKKHAERDRLNKMRRFYAVSA